MPTLTITRGLPASGKTTWAQGQVLATSGRTARVSRDDLRTHVLGVTGKAVLSYEDEQVVTRMQQALVRAALEAGRDVIVDDTNLRLKFARAWVDLAVSVGAEFAVNDEFLSVPVDVCVERDATRTPGVGADVIRGMHLKFLNGRPLPPVTPPETVSGLVEPYDPPEPGALPAAWLVDIDGTLALMNGRGPFEWDRVGEDAPNPSVVELARALGTQTALILMSGRDEVCRDATVAWLEVHGIGWDHLFMRPAGDMRKDSIIKAEMFDAHVRDRFDVRGVIDDRQQVVDMWRAMGLVVAQVAPGNF